MRGADEAGRDRAAKSELRFADLSMHPLRLRRELFADVVDRHMQIPAGDNRQGSAEKMTDGEWCHPVARQGPAPGLKSTAQIHARLFCVQRIIRVSVSGDTGVR